MPDWFRRRSKSEPQSPQTRQGDGGGEPPQAPPSASAAIPEGAFTKCAKCAAILYVKDFERDMKVCAKCGHHHRLGADDRIAYTVDEGTWSEFGNDFFADDPLEFPEYAGKLALGRENPKGRNDGLATGYARIGGSPCILGVVDFGYARLAGTMGSVFGEKFVRATDRAIAERLPFICFCASGGARMQEGLFGLMQMAKTSAAVAQLAENGIPYIVVLTDPTTGGAFASFASLGDVIFSEPGAYVAFAGQRVAQQAQTVKPPANYQTAEFQWEHGMVDKVVPRKEMALILGRTLRFFGVAGESGSESTPRLNGTGEANEDGLLPIATGEPVDAETAARNGLGGAG
jgi:acetyl-CoA carboxylase carboxyl transferase subunit beta